jgi:serine/threonine-protein kinase
MPDPSSERDPVEQLAEEFVERHRRGERPGLSEYTDRYPQFADAIRALFPALVQLEQLKPGSRDATGSYQAGTTQTEAKRLECLGDFRILREVGRGGMGIVYEAEQISLGRHVALKVLPHHTLLDPRHLQRFQREARSAARLHHTNIVPVYGVGEHAGLHYYVMQFIQGLGLDEVLQELQRLRQPQAKPDVLVTESLRQQPVQVGHTLSAAVAARSLLTGQFVLGAEVDPRAPPVVDTVEATAAASGMPAMVRGAGSSGKVPLPGASPSSTFTESGRAYWQSVARIGVQVADALAYAASQGIQHRDIKPSNLLLDAQGTIWVTDFGLAKADADQDNLTNTGDIVGTVRYMAPERFGGRSDQRSDFYSLGLTLYELATLRPAFPESDRNQLIQAVMHEEPPRLRKLNPAVPRDLETIILKAIAREPSHRYQAAADLAEDLRRFVEDKPIRARQVSQAERFWRWCRRNPAVAGLTATVALLLVLASVASTLAALRYSNLAEHERQARADAEAATARADAARLAAEQAQNREAEQRARADEARQRAERNQQAAERSQAEAERQQQRALENFRQARQAVDEFLTTISENRLLDVPGLQPLRKELLTQALRYYQEFLKGRANDPILQRDLASGYARMGKITAQIGSPAEALTFYEKARNLLVQLLRQTPANKDLMLELSACHLASATAQRHMGEPDTALKSCLAAYRYLLKVSPQQADRMTALHLGSDNRLSGIRVHTAESADLMLRFAEVLTELHATDRAAGDLAMAFRRLGEELYIQQRLIEVYPNHAQIAFFKRGLAEAWNRMGNFCQELGLVNAAQDAQEQALPILRTLVQESSQHPKRDEVRRDLAAVLESLGTARMGLNQLTAAQLAYDEALPVWDKLARENPAVTDYQADLARLLAARGRVLARRGNKAEGLQALRQAVARQEQLVAATSGVKSHVLTLCRYYREQAEMQRDCGQMAEADQTLELACRLLEKLASPNADEYYALAAARAARRGSEPRQAEAALAALRMALTAGFRDLQRLQNDRAWEPWRDRPNYQAIVAELSKKSTALVWLTDVEAARAQAARENKDLFIWLGGSDWALPDALSRRTILVSKPFMDFARQHFVLIDVDNTLHVPRPQSPTLEILRDQLDMTTLPRLILADAQGRAYADLQGAPFPMNETETAGAAREFVKTLEYLRMIRVNRDRFLAEAEKIQGRHRAQWLDQALRTVDRDHLHDYAAEIRTIRRLDADGAAGLRDQYIPALISVMQREVADCWREHNLGKAIEHLDRMNEDLELGAGDAHWVWNEHANVLAWLGQFETAVSTMALDAWLEGNTWPTWRNWAYICVQAGDADGYRRICRKLLEQFQDRSRAFDTFSATSTLCLGPQAVPDLDAPWTLAELAVQRRRNAYTLHIAALAQYRRGNSAAAIALYHEGLALNPEWPCQVLDWLGLALAHQHLDQSEEANRWLSRATQALALATQGKPFEEVDSPSRAMTAFGMAHSDKGHSWLDWQMCQVLLAEAAAVFEDSALARDLRLEVPRCRALVRLGNWEQALRAYGRAIQRTPANTYLWWERGRCQERLGHRDQATTDYREAVRLQNIITNQLRSDWERAPASAGKRTRLGWAYRTLAAMQVQAEQIDEAIATLTRQAGLWRNHGAELVQVIHAIGRALSTLPGNARPADREAARQRLVNLAVASLRQAAAAHYLEIGELRTAPNLEVLRRQKAFAGLLADVDMRSKFSLQNGETRRIGSYSDNSLACPTFSPDGRSLVTADTDGTIYRTDLASDKVLLKLRTPGLFKKCLAFCPDARYLLTDGADDGVEGNSLFFLCDVATGHIVRRFVGHQRNVTAAAFAPNGKRMVSASWDGTLRIWDVATGAPLHRLDGHTKVVTCCAFSPDGKWILSGSADQTIRMWNAATGYQLLRLDMETAVTGVAFLPDGRHALVAEEAQQVTLWNLDSGKLERLFTAHQSPLRGVVVLPDGCSAASVSADGKLLVWDIATCKVNLEYKSDVTPTGLTLAPGGRWLATAHANNTTVRLWKLEPQVALAATYARLGNLDAAEKAYTRLANVEPTEPAYAVARARILARRGRWREACALYDAALGRRADDSLIWVERGRCQAMLENWDQVALNFSQALQLIPPSYQGWDFSPRLAAELSQWEPAMDRALQRRPDDPLLLTARARSLARRRQWAGAAADYRRAARSLTDPEFFCECAPALVLAGDLAEYQRLARQNLERFGQTLDGRTAYLVARACALAPKAVADLHRPITLAEQAVTFWKTAWHLHTLALAHYRAGHFQEAVYHAQESLAIDPNWLAHVDNWFVLAMAHHALGDQAEARQWFDKAQQWIAHTEPQADAGGSVTLLNMHPHDGLACRVLQREAAALFSQHH